MLGTILGTFAFNCVYNFIVEVRHTIIKAFKQNPLIGHIRHLWRFLDLHGLLIKRSVLVPELGLLLSHSDAELDGFEEAQVLGMLLCYH